MVTALVYRGNRNNLEDKKNCLSGLSTYFDIIADVARLSRSYPPSEPDMADADQSVVADLPRRCQVRTTNGSRNFSKGPSAPKSVDGEVLPFFFSFFLFLCLGDIRRDSPFLEVVVKGVGVGVVGGNQASKMQNAGWLRWEGRVVSMLVCIGAYSDAYA